MRELTVSEVELVDGGSPTVKFSSREGIEIYSSDVFADAEKGLIFMSKIAPGSLLGLMGFMIKYQKH